MSGQSHPHFSRTRIASLLLVALLGVAIMAPSSAPAASPAAVDQYNGGGVGPDEGSGGSGSNAGNNNAGENAAGGGSSSGSLPFTGYPLTPLLVLMAALMAAGLAIRSGVAVNDRLKARTTSSYPRS